MYVISIYVENNSRNIESYGMIGQDYCLTGETDLKATAYSSKEDAIDYLKSAGYEADSSYGNKWRMLSVDGSVTSYCHIWKVGEL